jgi:hypothetical protein
MVRTIKHHIWNLCAPVEPSGHQPSGSERSKPYFGNYVQPKCNRPDARATPSERGLVMEAFSAILERRFQLTVRTLGQAVRTPSGILVITFYSNIGLGRNWRRWKANEILYKLIVWTAIILIRKETLSVRTALQNFLELLFRHGNSSSSGRPRLPSGRACQRFHFWLELGLLKPINKGF